MRFLQLLPAALLWCAGSVCGQSNLAPSALDKSTMEQYVRHLFVWGPQIDVSVADPKPSSHLPGFKEVSVRASAGQASKDEIFYGSNDGSRIVRGTVYDVAKNPFEEDRARITTDSQPGFGPPEAPVTLVIFSDFQCSFCRQEAKVIRENLAKEFPEQVRVYFKDFPLEPIHAWARPAAVAGRCVFGQNPAAFWEYHDWIFENQSAITPENLREKVLEWAKTNSLEPIQFGACLESKATDPEITKSIAEGRSLNLNSTPTMFVNGRRLVGNVPWPQLQQIVSHEIEYQNNRGGEKCCQITLPSPLDK